MSDKNTPAALSGEFHDGAHPHKNTPPAHVVMIQNQRSEYWMKAVKEWAAHEKISFKITPVQGSQGQFVEFGFWDHSAATSFCMELVKNSFDVEARDLEHAAAGVKLEQAGSIIPWAASNRALG